ncbi:MAG: hypothetical protein IJT69_03010 [Clostridia bacterium]|nr:hypothetical protein [Clostridia bacterium]
MKKRIVTITLIALVVVIAMSLGGCFFENLSIISGKMSGESADALDAFNTELTSEDANGDLRITLSNFSQINKARGSVGGYSGSAVFEFKCAENGLYIASYSTDNVSVADKYEYYIEKDGEFWFAYAQNPSNHNEWKVAAIDVSRIATSIAPRDTFLAETRKNIFSAENYKISGDHYAYDGPTLVFSQEDDYKLVMNVEGLFTIENGIEIKGQVEPEMSAEQKAEMAQAGYSLADLGFEFPFSYSIYDVGSTKITFPSVINSDYKAQYKAAHQPQNGNNDNGKEDSGEED